MSENPLDIRREHYPGFQFIFGARQFDLSICPLRVVVWVDPGKDFAMTTLSNTFTNAPIARLRLLFGSIVIFASMTATGQAESLYPQLMEPVRSADVIRPCTQLELSADMLPSECGTLTLAEVVNRMYALEGRHDN